MPAIELSILIVSWNVKEFVLACLAAIVRHVTGLSYEVILIDNHSHDGTVEEVARRFPQVRIIANQANLGFAAANNQGLAVARGAYLVLLNPDTVLLENSFRKFIDCFAQRAEVGAIGCRMVNAAGEVDYQCAKRMPTIANHLFEPYVSKLVPGLMRSFVMREWDHETSREVELLSGACLALRREVFETVGKLDDAMFMYVEDVDYSLRVRKAGWVLFYLADTTIIHHGGQSTQHNKHALQAENVRNLRRFFAKHRSRLYGGAFVIILICEYIAKYLVLSTLSLVLPRYRQADVSQYLRVALKLVRQP